MSYARLLLFMERRSKRSRHYKNNHRTNNLSKHDKEQGVLLVWSVFYTAMVQSQKVGCLHSSQHMSDEDKSSLNAWVEFLSCSKTAHAVIHPKPLNDVRRRYMAVVLSNLFCSHPQNRWDLCRLCAHYAVSVSFCTAAGALSVLRNELISSHFRSVTYSPSSALSTLSIV